MPGREWTPFSFSGILVQALLVTLAHPAVGQLNLGPEELVQAEGADIDVPGYSVPSFTYWNGDNIPDLIVGQGSGTTGAKVRVYLNVGTACSPDFSGFVYAQSDGGDLVVPGGG